MAPTKPSKRADDNEVVTDTSQKTKSGRVEKKTSDEKKEKKTRDWSQYTHEPPTAAEISKNGRKNGRVLIKWNRPRMLEKLLLHMEYECVRARKPVPWASIAHRLSKALTDHPLPIFQKRAQAYDSYPLERKLLTRPDPGSSPAAVEQYLRRIRRDLMAEGHMVPPIPQKPGGPVQDPAVRGFVRRTMHDPKNLTMRPVLWTEPMEDRTSPASDAALAHDALEAENSDAEMMESEDPSLSSMRGKKRINSVSEGFDGFDAHTRRPSTKLSYAESNHEQFEDADDEAGEFDDGSTDQISRGSPMTSSSKGSAHAHVGQAPNRAGGMQSGHVANNQLQDAGFNNNFSFVTPKRRSGYIPDAFSEGLLDAVITTPTGNHFRFAPVDESLAAAGFEAQGAYIGYTGPAGFVATGSRSFLTAASSPANFDPLNETPNTAAAMRAHLYDWNGTPLRSMATASTAIPLGAGNAGPTMGLLTPEEPEAVHNHDDVWNHESDVPSMFSST